MHRPILVLALLALPMVPAGAALAQGFPGATVGIPLGKPDPFGPPTSRPAEPMAAPFADPSTEREAAGADRRPRAQARRHLKGQHAGPKRRPPLARR